VLYTCDAQVSCYCEIVTLQYIYCDHLMKFLLKFLYCLGKGKGKSKGQSKGQGQGHCQGHGQGSRVRVRVYKSIRVYMWCGEGQGWGCCYWLLAIVIVIAFIQL